MDATCSPNPCSNQGVCSIKLLQVECACPEKFFGKLCEFSEKDSEKVYAEYSRYVSSFNSNLTDSQIKKIDELNTLMNQNPSYASKNITDQITNLTCNKL